MSFFVHCSLKQREFLIGNVPFCVPCSLKEGNASLEKVSFTIPCSMDQNELVYKIVLCSLNCFLKQREQFSKIIPFYSEYLSYKNCFVSCLAVKSCALILLVINKLLKCCDETCLEPEKKLKI